MLPSTVNLDAMSPEDLGAFVRACYATKDACIAGDMEAANAVRSLCGCAPGNNAPRLGVLDSLREYAAAKRRAMCLRLEGKIAAADSIERRLDAIYEREIVGTPAAW